VGMFGGNCCAALEMAAWMSWAAGINASRQRKLHRDVGVAMPLVRVIDSMPAIVERTGRSSGIATAESHGFRACAGRNAVTWMVG